MEPAKEGAKAFDEDIRTTIAKAKEIIAVAGEEDAKADAPIDQQDKPSRSLVKL